jgi:undecaprenyl diphosphate synthase
MAESPKELPRHVAVIMDGNGRWAARRGLPRTEGHRAGAEAARAAAQACSEWGIPVLTLYAFSTENWKRPAAEVRFLMSNLRSFLRKHRGEFVENNIRLRVIGAPEELPTGVQKELRLTLEATAGCDGLLLVLALNYGSHREITEAARALARQAQAGILDPEEIDEAALEEHLYTAGLPPLDLVIRTGGEMRLSNFLLWQVQYAELYVTDTLWPDFDKEEFHKALQEFARRERRWGAVRDEVRATPTHKAGGAAK